MSRSSSAASLESSARHSRRGALPDPVFAQWTPSERVQALTSEQIDEIKQRLNVTVEVEDGESSPVAPIESFKDMVGDRFSSCQSA